MLLSKNVFFPMLGIFEAPFFCSQTSMESATPRWSRSTLVEQTTPMGHLLFDTSALARNLDFLDIDVDRDLFFFDRRKNNLGTSKWKGVVLGWVSLQNP